MFKLPYITVMLALLSVAALAAPYQELAPRAGHVPVYIREGDTPLSEIHPKLAEAFHEEEQVVKNQVEHIAPEVAPQVEEETNEKKTEDEITINNDESKVDEVAASDIAEFDDVKSTGDDEQPEKIETPIRDNEQ